MTNCDTSINIFASREALEVLLETVNYAIAAAKSSPQNVQVNVLINGNHNLYQALVDNKSQLNQVESVEVTAYDFAFGDKANVWNQYFYQLAGQAQFHIFIDGYVNLYPDTIAQIEQSFEQEPFLAATGVPSAGRSAKHLKQQMIEHGGIHGNLCIFTRACIDKIVEKQFRLPVGLYRVDGLIGAVINFNFSPKNNAWNAFGVKVIAELTWSVEQSSVFSLQDLYAQFKRKIRQAQGDIENNAIKHLFNDEKIEVADLPATSQALCLNHLADQELGWSDYLVRPFHRICVNRIKALPKQALSRNLSEYKETIL